MATTKYNFRPHENLSMIAKRYHTDIKTLTTLNSWLINPHTGKTEMFPAKIKYTYSQNNSVAQRILVDKPIKPGTLIIKAYTYADKSGPHITWSDDSYGQIRTGNGTITYVVNYTSRILEARDLMTLQKQYKALEISYDADFAKDFLIVPLIGNGNTSIEDYWENVDKVTGISFSNLMENLSNDPKQLLDTSALYAQTDNGRLTQATTDFVSNALLDTSVDASISEDSSNESNILTNGGNQAGLPEYDNYISDFSNARIGGIIQTAINEGSKNMRDYFLYNFDHTNNGLYGSAVDSYTSDSGLSAGYTYDKVKRAIDSATAGGYTAALYGNKATGFYSYSNGLYGDLDTGLNANKIISAQNQRWSRDKLSLYDYQTIGTQRNNDILQAVEVTIGNTLIYMPCWPEQVSDGVDASYDTINVMGRSAPYVIYSYTGERSIEFTFKLHREMLDNPIALLTEDIIKNPDQVATRAGEIDRIVRIIESAVYPNYDGTVAAVRTQVRIGNTLFISGVMTSQSTNWYGPIGTDHKYKQCDITFTVLEATNSPKSQSEITQIGGWRK